MSRRLRGSRRADDLHEAILDLLGEFEEELAEKGLSGRQIDAHIAATLINLLRLIVVERETYSAGQLSKVVKKTLQEAQHEH